MRTKERAHDYRYFPEPDLPPLEIDPVRLHAVHATMPELPDARRRRFVTALGLPEYDASILTQSRAAADFFEAVVEAGAPAKSASNWIMGELARALKDAGRDITDAPIGPARLAGLIALVERGTISGAIAKGVFEIMLASGRSAEDIVHADGLTQIDDEAELTARVEEVLAANADAVAQFQSGKTNALGFLVGQVMKATGGKANPKRVNELLRGRLA
jgi:aspartyl-tRNA(Asn)/glutamyl-tRNA(Gln) amidotransferase subunit B